MAWRVFIIATSTFVLISSNGLHVLEKAFAQNIPAKKLFGNVKTPTKQASNSYGGYTRGCLAGGREMPIDGDSWQAMRLSRQRNWGHERLVRYLKQLATEAKKIDGWPGLLVGDMAQPRGGPMLTGHRSHQIGLDADIWMMPMPDRKLTYQEREKMSAISVLAEDKISVNREHWQPGHVTLLKRAASYPGIARIFVHPAIKKELCNATAESDDRSWLRLIRPWWGHHYHFHVRLKCPLGSKDCKDQNPPPAGDGCGKELDNWIKLVDPNRKRPKPKVTKPKKKPKPRPDITLADLPKACSVVIGKAAQVSQSDDVPLPVKKSTNIQ